MRLALITETFPPQINGVSRTLGKLAEFMTSHGHELLVIQPEYRDLDKKNDFKINVHDKLKIVSLKAWPLPFYPEIMLPRPPFTTMKKALVEFQPDLVHIATEAALGLSALRFCRRQGWPVVSSFHTNFDAYARHYRMPWLVNIVSKYLRWFHNRTLATFVPSPTLIHRLEKNGFERLLLWPRGVDAQLFAPQRSGAAEVRQQWKIPANAFVVGHCGRLAPEKNAEYLEQVFQDFLRLKPADHLFIVGDGPSRKSLEMKLNQSPEIASRVHFTGYKTGVALADCYSAMNCFAFASRTETFGNVILEAMASGLPVVALAEGGPVDVIQHQKTGILLSPDAPPSAMVKELQSWSENQVQASLLGTSARQYAVSQTWDATMSSLLQHYLTIISQLK